MIGERKTFTYQGGSEIGDNYTKHSGQECVVQRQLTNDETDLNDIEIMFKIRFDDGFVGDVFESELT